MSDRTCQILKGPNGKKIPSSGHTQGNLYLARTFICVPHFLVNLRSVKNSHKEPIYSVAENLFKKSSVFFLEVRTPQPV